MNPESLASLTEQKIDEGAQESKLNVELAPTEPGLEARKPPWNPPVPRWYCWTRRLDPPVLALTFARSLNGRKNFRNFISNISFIIRIGWQEKAKRERERERGDKPCWQPNTAMHPGSRAGPRDLARTVPMTLDTVHFEYIGFN